MGGDPMPLRWGPPSVDPQSRAVTPGRDLAYVVGVPKYAFLTMRCHRRVAKLSLRGHRRLTRGTSPWLREPAAVMGARV